MNFFYILNHYFHSISYICQDNINIFLKVIISFFFNHHNDSKRIDIYKNMIYMDVEKKIIFFYYLFMKLNTY